MKWLPGHMASVRLLLYDRIFCLVCEDIKHFSEPENNSVENSITNPVALFKIQYR